MLENLAWIGTGSGPEASLFQAYIYVVMAGVVLLVAAVLFGIWYLVAKFLLHRKVKKLQSIVLCVVISFVGLYAYFVLPSNISDNRWQNTLEYCGQVAGYESHRDDNNPNIATSESQQVFRECIDGRERSD